MFFADPVAAFTHLRAAVRPGGRLAFVCWQSREDNAWTTVPADALAAVVTLAPAAPDAPPDGFAFQDPARVRGILDAAGWTDIDLIDTARTVHLGDSADEAVAFIQQMDYAKAALDPASPEQRAEALESVRAAFQAQAGAGGDIDLPGRVLAGPRPNLTTRLLAPDVRVGARRSTARTESGGQWCSSSRQG